MGKRDIAFGVEMATRITRRNLKSGLSAFVDLLGFSARVQGIRTEADLIALDDDVTFVQGQFEHKPTEEYIQTEHKLVGKRVLAFSDCIVINVPLRSKLAKTAGTFDLLMSELTSFAWAQGACLQRGIFLRGGVALGIWFHRKDTLISPAMVDAYNLEHEACVPMIAITPQLQAFLSNHTHRNGYHQDADPFPEVLSEHKNLPNKKSQWFINYLRICLHTVEPRLDRQRYLALDPDGRDHMRQEEWIKATRKWARDHGDAIARAHAAAEASTVRAKYEWLAQYHNEEIERFFGKHSKRLKVKLA